MNETLKSKLESLPALPGIYQFADKNNKIIYIGKAKNLRNRVRSYFHSSVDSPKTKALVSKVEDFQLIITDSEVEALVLENNLIKDLKPRYNINLKDDKSFPYIRVTNEPFPQIFPTRDIIKDGSKYFGPYTDVKSMKASLRMINKLFKIRSCKYFIDDEVIQKKKIKVCLDYHIKKCDGPCEGFVSESDYNDMVGEVVKLMRGKTVDLINDLKEKMHTASSLFKFEKAAEIRDKIDQLQVYSDRQKIVSNDFEDRDVISAAVEGKDVAATILNIRSGKLVGKKTFKLSIELNEELNKIYTAVLKFYYNEYVEVPKEIILETEPYEKDSILEWLNTKAFKTTKLIVPQRKSEAMSLLNMSKQNAILQLKEIQLQRMKKEGNIPYVLSSLKRDLHLKNIPKKIECFDISNLQGTDTVASMVVFSEGKPKKSEYRRYIIKSVEGPDDFASMQEVIERRYSKLISENLPLPELIMVDGGKGQLSSTVEILDNIIGKDKYEIIGLAKRLEEVILKGISEPQSIPKTSSSLKLLQHIRDEAHRFAITFHRERRSKRTFTSELVEIKGIGKTIAEKLLKEFKSIEDIKNSSIEDMGKIIGKAKAVIVKNHYSAGNSGN
ncbi:MAG: excinuclease ABC subunit UvrC [Bacteroidetes bacterium]|nr:excinuclease ABC subunit UvrC [Bacteroidota bacterium]